MTDDETHGEDALKDADIILSATNSVAMPMPCLRPCSTAASPHHRYDAPFADHPQVVTGRTNRIAPPCDFREP